MSSLESALPIRCVPHSDESGLGYCLRTIAANGANFHALRRLQMLPYKARFTQTQSWALASLFEVDQAWLASVLPPEEKSGYRDCYGHRWHSPPYLLRSTPQVCPLCIHRNGYAKAVWDLALATSCLEHGCLLSDQCADCSQQLRWDRPSLGVGHCGHVLKAGREPCKPDDRLIAFQIELEERFSSVPITAGLLTGLPGSPELSIDGWCALVVALGIHEHPFQVTRQLGRSRRTSEWLDIVNRSVSRISAIAWLEQDALRASASLVSEALLKRILKRHGSSVDQKVALRLLQEVFGSKPAGRMGGDLDHLSQLEMF